MRITTFLTAVATTTITTITTPHPSTSSLTVQEGTTTANLTSSTILPPANNTLPNPNSPIAHLASDHSFSTSCTNIHGDFIDTILWACCSDMSGSWWQNRFRLGQCLRNVDGKLVPRRNGAFWKTCQDCGLKDPSRPTVYSCRCWPMPIDGWQPKLVDAEIDLDTFMGNDRGRLVCFGVKENPRKEACEP